MKKIIIAGFALALTATPALADPPSHGSRSIGHSYADGYGYGNDNYGRYSYDGYGSYGSSRHARHHAREDQRRHHRQHHREQRRHNRYGH